MEISGISSIILHNIICFRERLVSVVWYSVVDYDFDQIYFMTIQGIEIVLRARDLPLDDVISASACFAHL